MTICASAAGVYGGKPYMDFYVPLNIVIPIAFVLFCVSGLLALTRFRRYNIVRRRNKYAIALTACGAFMGGIATHIRDASGPANFPCILNGLLNWLVAPFLSGPSILALTRLVNQYELAELRAKKKPRQQSTTTGTGTDFDDATTVVTEYTSVWQDLKDYIRSKLTRGARANNVNRFRTSQYYVYFWLAVSFVPYLVGFFITLALTPEWQHNCNGCEMTQAEASVLIVLIMATVGLGVYQCFLLFKHEDRLYLIPEFFLAFSIGGTFAFIGQILYIVDPEGLMYSRRYLNWRVIQSFGVTLVIFFQTYFPILVAVHLGAINHIENASTMDEKLAEIVQDSDALQLLKEHMASTLSDESILFYEAVMNWRLKGRKKHKARQIFDKYVAANSELEINVSSEQRSHVTQVFKHYSESANFNLPEDIFDECFDEIETLIKTDSLPRFLASSLYREGMATLGSRSPKPKSTASTSALGLAVSSASGPSTPKAQATTPRTPQTPSPSKQSKPNSLAPASTSSEHQDMA